MEYVPGRGTDWTRGDLFSRRNRGGIAVQVPAATVRGLALAADVR
jgi:hypothetical protein